MPSLLNKIWQAPERLDAAPLEHLLKHRFAGVPEEAFLDPRLGRLSDPFAVPDLESAAVRLNQAVEAKEAITVFGDYDADGVTAAAVMFLALREIDAKVDVFLPSRFETGYGLTGEGVKQCLEQFPQTQLLLTVDCGVKAVKQVAALREHGIDVIITDHHTPGETLPDTWVVGAHRIADPCVGALAGVGMAFKVLHGLLKHRKREGLSEFNLKPLLDLVALGTVADVVPLLGENRILVRNGLMQINKGGSKVGLRRLIESLCDEKAVLTSIDLAFRLGPCINAAGRMASPEHAYRLLVTDSPDEAQALAIQLGQYNAARKQEEERAFHLVLRLLRVKPERPFTGAAAVVASKSFSIGTAGIIAARAVELFGCPVAIGAEQDDGSVRGSVRAPEGYHVAEALEAAASALESGGGHSAAGGFSVAPGRFAQFKKLFVKACAQQAKEGGVGNLLALDGWLEHDEVGLPLTDAMERMEPFGEGNPVPVWGVQGVILRRADLTRDGKHVQLEFAIGRQTVRGIWFRAAQHVEALREHGARPFNVAFQLEKDSFFQTPRVKMLVRDLQFA